MPIDPKTGRPVAGPADRETIRQRMRETRETEKAEARKFVEKRATKKKPPGKPASNDTTLRKVLNPRVPRERRVGEEGKTMEQVVDEAVKGAKPDPY